MTKDKQILRVFDGGKSGDTSGDGGPPTYEPPPYEPPALPVEYRVNIYEPNEREMRHFRSSRPFAPFSVGDLIHGLTWRYREAGAPYSESHASSSGLGEKMHPVATVTDVVRYIGDFDDWILDLTSVYTKLIPEDD